MAMAPPFRPYRYENTEKPADYETNRDRKLSFLRLITETEKSYLIQITKNRHAWIGKRFCDIHINYMLAYSKYINPNENVSEKWLHDPDEETNRPLEIGDEVYCERYGNGKVTAHNPTRNNRPRCQVTFPHNNTCTLHYYTDTGTYIGLYEYDPKYKLSRGHK